MASHLGIKACDSLVVGLPTGISVRVDAAGRDTGKNIVAIITKRTVQRYDRRFCGAGVRRRSTTINNRQQCTPLYIITNTQHEYPLERTI
jgi:hypothetical protein